MRSNKYNKKKKIGIYIYYPNESIACSPSNTKKRWLLDFSLSDRMKSVWMYFADFIWLKFCKKWDIFFFLVWGTPTKAQKAPNLAFVGLSKLIGPGLDWSAWRKIFNPRLNVGFSWVHSQIGFTYPSASSYAPWPINMMFAHSVD